MPNRLAPDKFCGPSTYDAEGVTDDPTYGSAHLHVHRHANINTDSDKHALKRHAHLMPSSLQLFLSITHSSTPICETIRLCERAHSWLCNIFNGPSGNSGDGHSNSIIAS